MVPIVLEQGSREWLAWYKAGVGSSDALVIAADAGLIHRESWMDNIDQLYEKKLRPVSKEEDDRCNGGKSRGKKLEPYARRAFETTTGLAMSPMCATMDGCPMIRASFDGVSLDMASYLELKVPSAEVHQLAADGRVIGYYQPELAHLGLVMWGDPAQWPDDGIGHFGTYWPTHESQPDSGEIHRIVVRSSNARIRRFATELLAAEKEFIRCLSEGVPPCGKEYAALANRRSVIAATLEQVKTDLDAVDGKMIALTQSRGKPMMSRLGVTTSQLKRQGSIDYRRLIGECGIDAEEAERYRKSPSECWSVRSPRKRSPARVAAS